ncbi:MAG: lycopene cyclase [Williamsia sp.]|nr:lycopene cyclase [Williamsia sp.]
MSAQSPHYDYIIAGAGAAGLSLLVQLTRAGLSSHKKILLIDKAPKTLNDRTWCFWEQGEGPFEEIVFRKWNRLWYHGENFSRLLNVSPYAYKMIRGIDFYKYCFDIIEEQKEITVAYGDITGMYSRGGETGLCLDNRKITADKIFSSIYTQPVLKNREHFLQQHFKGWIIKTAEPHFNPQEATLMDFRVAQRHGTTFVYVMPFSTTEALVEYTLFTEDLLLPHQYDEGLKDYIKNFLHCPDYQVVEKEFGVIPMTNYRFPVRQGNIIRIGTAGGQTKASSGYTFRFIQKSTGALLNGLSGGLLQPSSPSLRYRFYDSVLLNVLATQKAAGATIFSELFKKNPPHRIFRFLDNESTLPDDIRLISTLPVWPFLQAGFQEIFRL